MPSDGDHLPPASMENSTGPKDYALSGKIMLSAIVILFLVVLLMVTLHLYGRWYLLRQRRRQLLLRRRSRLSGTRRANIVFYVDNDNPSNLVTGPNHPANKGLEPAVLRSLPVFAFSSTTHPDGLECAVCLSEFEEDEKGRILPACNHSFHTGCIDMWFHSHSTCPICRAAVEPVIKQEESSVNLVVEGADSSSAMCSACRHEEGGSSSMPPLASRRKGLDLTAVRIDVPRMMSELEPELPLSSPAGHGFRSPGARLLSLKRILSMGRRTSTGSSASSSAATPCGAAAAGTSCNPAGTTTEPDLESGATELARVHTPR